MVRFLCHPFAIACRLHGHLLITFSLLPKLCSLLIWPQLRSSLSSVIFQEAAARESGSVVASMPQDVSFSLPSFCCLSVCLLSHGEAFSAPPRLVFSCLPLVWLTQKPWFSCMSLSVSTLERAGFANSMVVARRTVAGAFAHQVQAEARVGLVQHQRIGCVCWTALPRCRLCSVCHARLFVMLSCAPSSPPRLIAFCFASIPCRMLWREWQMRKVYFDGGVLLHVQARSLARSGRTSAQAPGQRPPRPVRPRRVRSFVAWSLFARSTLCLFR